MGREKRPIHNVCSQGHTLIKKLVKFATKAGSEAHQEAWARLLVPRKERHVTL